MVFCWTEEISEFAGQILLIAGLALPDHDGLPPLVRGPRKVTSIPGLVPVEFGFPEVSSRLWDPACSAPFMLMPETAVDEDDLAAARESQIRSPGSSLPLQAETIAKSVQEPPHDPFRFRVRPTDTPHVRAALGSCESIGHRHFTKIEGSEERMARRKVAPPCHPTRLQIQ